MVLIFILLLLLAIWAAFKFGGVRKAEEPEKPEKGGWLHRKPADDGKPEDEDSESGLFRGKGGGFGGGGASGSWGEDPEDSGKARKDWRHKD